MKMKNRKDDSLVLVSHGKPTLPLAYQKNNDSIEIDKLPAEGLNNDNKTIHIFVLFLEFPL